jgi:hypothetical protein
MPTLQPLEMPLQFGIFLPLMHTTGVNPTLAIKRDLELVTLLDELGYAENLDRGTPFRRLGADRQSGRALLRWSIEGRGSSRSTVGVRSDRFSEFIEGCRHT